MKWVGIWFGFVINWDQEITKIWLRRQILFKLGFTLQAHKEISILKTLNFFHWLTSPILFNPCPYIGLQDYNFSHIIDMGLKKEKYIAKTNKTISTQINENTDSDHQTNNSSRLWCRRMSASLHLPCTLISIATCQLLSIDLLCIFLTYLVLLI